MITSRDLAPTKGHVPVAKGDHPVRSLQGDVNRLFNEFFGDFAFPAFDRLTVFAPTPAIDVAETDSGYRVTAELPGIAAKDVEITVADGYLTLKGEKSHQHTTTDKGFVRQERTFGSFRRVFALPKDADLDHAQAELKDGILTLTVTKHADADADTRKIDIREVA